MAKNIRKRHKGTKSGGKPSLGSHPNVSLDGTGYDWGWPAIELAWANDELVRRLRAGGFVGCGYGLLSAGGPPFLALVGENVKGMRSALALMREWADAVGPNAISVEILFDGAGYVISVGQQPDLLRWRLRGIDPSEDALVFGISLSKRLDTRHPFLDQLADYSRQPVAPVYLTIASVPPDAVRRPGALDAGALASMDRQGLMLPGIRVYVRPEDRPIDSFIRLESEMPSEEGPRPLPDSKSDPASVVRRRELRLLATMPKTIHVLRHRTAGRALVANCMADGCATWQVEQAVANLRLEAHLAYQPRSAHKRQSMLEATRIALVEPASAPFNVADLPYEVVNRQILLDAAFLLRRIEPDSSLPKNLADHNARLVELGYA